MKLQIKIYCTILMVAFYFAPSIHTKTYRLTTYNLLDFSGQDAADLVRLDAYRTILSHIDPDVLVVQEILDDDALNVFLRDVFTYSQNKNFRFAPFSDGPFSDNGLFYDTLQFEYLSQEHFSTNYRDISHYRLLPVKIDNPETLHVYVAHLKAGSDWQDERNHEAVILRQNLNAYHNSEAFIVCGDFNFYSANEPGYQTLIEAGNDSTGRCFDPISTSGDWHNNVTYASLHTQSTHSISSDPFAGGGLDDRFDIILTSRVFFLEGGYQYIESSYTPFGNDGLHFNLAINFGNNQLIHPDMAQALYSASDHLPVYLDFQVGSSTSVKKIHPSVSENLMFFKNFPNPFNSRTNIYFQMIQDGYCNLVITDVTGRKVDQLFEGNLKTGMHCFVWNGCTSEGSDLPSGLYFVFLIQARQVLTRKLILLR